MHEGPIVIANWKLALDHDQSIVFAGQIANSEKEFCSQANIILCPSAVSLEGVRDALGDETKIALGGQNVHYEALGPYTGEISILAVKQLGAKYLIIGHSERRKYFHETNEDVAKKVALALTHGLIPIVCIGETYEDRQRQQAELVVCNELEAALHHVDLDANQKIIIAYEPVWAIGTGQAINPQDAHMMGMVIHQKMIDTIAKKNLGHMRVVYGGSVDAANVADFVDGRVLSGVLVGGASQNFHDFHSLVLALKKK